MGPGTLEPTQIYGRPKGSKGITICPTCKGKRPYWANTSAEARADAASWAVAQAQHQKALGDLGLAELVDKMLGMGPLDVNTPERVPKRAARRMGRIGANLLKDLLGEMAAQPALTAEGNQRTATQPVRLRNAMGLLLLSYGAIMRRPPRRTGRTKTR